MPKCSLTHVEETACDPRSSSLPPFPNDTWSYKLSFLSQHNHSPPGTPPSLKMSLDVYSGPLRAIRALSHYHNPMPSNLASTITRSKFLCLPRLLQECLISILEVNCTLWGRTQGCPAHHCVPVTSTSGLQDQVQGASIVGSAEDTAGPSNSLGSQAHSYGRCHSDASV